MTTVENLLVQIFERKKWIIEQAKQQTELYNQHLASKLLIHGVTPPPWLWNPNPSRISQLNKQDLISELLLPHPWRPVRYSSARYSLYSKSIVRDFPEVSDGFCTETHGSNKGLDGGEGPSTVVECHDIDVGNNLNPVPELDGSVGSPIDQIDSRISNIYSSSDQSLARIQRSKSRQRALELRNSAKSLAKSHPRNEGHNDGSSCGIRFSALDSEFVDHLNEAPKLPEPGAIGGQICGEKENNEGDGQTFENGSTAARRATRSGGSGKSHSKKESSERNFGAEDDGCDVHMGSSTKSRRSGKIIGDMESNEGDSQSKEKDKGIVTGRTSSSSSPGISCTDGETNEGNSLIEANRIYSQAVRITTPRSYSKCINYACDSLTVYSSSDVVPIKDVVGSTSVITQKNDITQICFMDDLTQQPCCANGSLELVVPPKVSQEVSGVKEAVLEDGCLQKDECPNVYCGQTTRSKSFSWQDDCVNLVSESNVDSSLVKMDRNIVEESRGRIMQQLDNSNESSAVVKISGATHRKRRSENTSCEEQTANPAHNCASGLRCIRIKLSPAEKVAVANCQLQNASGGQVIRDTLEKIEQQENGEAIVAKEVETDNIVEERFLNYRSDCVDTNLRRGLECLVASPPSDCFMIVKPKQLDFYDMRDLNENFGLSMERERLEKSAERICSTFPEAASSPDKDSSYNKNVTPSQEKSSVLLEVSSDGELSRKSYRSNVAGDIAFQNTRYGPITDEHSELKSTEYDSEPVYRQNSLLTLNTDVTLPKAVETPDIEINNLDVPSKQGCNSSPELHAEGGECRREEKDGSRNMSDASRCTHSVPTYSSSFTQQATGDSQLPLAKEAGYEDTCNDLDASRQYCVKDNQTLSFSGIESCCGHVDQMSFSDKIMGSSFNLGRNGSMSQGSAVSAGFDDKILDVTRPREVETADKCLNPETGSEACETKRRKTEVNCFIASPSIEIQKLYESQMDTVRDIRCSSDTVLGETTSGTKIPDVTIYSNMKHNETKIIESLPEDRRNKDGLCSRESNESPKTCSPVNHEMSAISLAPRLTAETNGGIQGGYLVEAITTTDPRSIIFYARIHGGEQNLNLCTERHLAERKSVSEEDGLLAHNSVESPQGKDRQLFDDDKTMPGELACAERNILETDLLSFSVQSPQMGDVDLKGADQTMPVFEGFIIDPQPKNEGLHLPEDIINISELSLPTSSIARASILEQICKSASACTPLSYMSSASKLNRFKNLFQSVPNGLLEHTDLQCNQFLDEDIDNQFRASFSNANEANNALRRMPYSDCLPCSSNQYGLDPAKQYTSPLSKIWESFSSQNGSSGKRLSSNPELTCFPIEEDPSTSEGNETADEIANKIQEDFDSSDVSSAKREPQPNITTVCLNPPESLSAAEKFQSRGSVDPIGTEPSFPMACSKVKHKLGNAYRNNGVGKENQSLSMGANGTKKAKESLNNRDSRPKLSGKAGLRNERRKLSDKETKHNNIVSNVTSFIPLVQQKQAAAVCTGKREIKVKALEAAEAAKRLDEKRQNERKLRKEALKLERAKMEQENARQAELNKKKKEEEQRKKDADMAARKRLREEEERKEKERKRMRIEETQRQKKEKEEKLQAEKVDKEKQRAIIDSKIINKKESNNELSKHQNVEKEKRDDVTCKKLETEPRTAATVTTDLQEKSTSKECSASDTCDNKQVDESDLVREKALDKSYEISPYQCSDDEDDEVEDLPTKKFIPSWASKNSVALALSLQQGIDPDIIFPPESFCSMDEVLLPRKLLQKQAAM